MNAASLSKQAIEAWEKFKHCIRRPGRGPVQEAMSNAFYFAWLAERAPNYLTRHGVELFGAGPVFDAGWDALEAVAHEVKLPRGVAS